jgi:hypothetical protein
VRQRSGLPSFGRRVGGLMAADCPATSPCVRPCPISRRSSHDAQTAVAGSTVLRALSEVSQPEFVRGAAQSLYQWTIGLLLKIRFRHASRIAGKHSNGSWKTPKL